MIDRNSLEGAAARDGDGLSGHVVGDGDRVLRVRWENESALNGIVESVLKEDSERMEQVQVLTPKKGWQPASKVRFEVEVATARTSAVAESVRGVLDEAAKKKPKPSKGAKKKPSKEKIKKKVTKPKAKTGGAKSGSHYPFKRSSTLSDGPKGRTHKRKNVWDCSCPTTRTCKCKNKKTGATKTIRINPGYQKSYNKCYKYFKKTRSKKYC